MLNEVVGQEKAVFFLKKVVAGDLQTPLLLVGDEGIGKRFSVTCAIVDIVQNHRPLDVPQVLQNVHPDVMQVASVAGKEIGIDAIRDLVTRAQSYPVSAPYRFFVVDGADKMTGPSANALLKTLEERPGSSLFFLLANNLDRILPTIRSRCGVVKCNKLPESAILSRLSKIENDSIKALVYARIGEGSLGRSIRYWGSNKLVLRNTSFSILEAFLKKDVPSIFSILDEVSKEISTVLHFLVMILHDLLLYPFDAKRIVNQDLLEKIALVHSSNQRFQLSSLYLRLREVQSLDADFYVNTLFQVKTAFLSE